MAPGLEFHWPSRSRDLKLARDGALPPNARPFPVDDPAGVRALAARMLGIDGNLAEPLLAAFLARQGSHFDVVEVPSTLPIAHLVRPAAEAFAITVGTVAQTWLGSASDVASLAWPDAAGPLEIARLARLEAESDSAVELRLAPAGACPPCPNGAPRRAVAARSILGDGRIDGSPGPARLFAPADLPRAGLGAFLRLVATLPEALRQYARLPCDLPADLARALAADPVGRHIPALARGEAAIAIDCAPRPVFNPAPLEILCRGGRAIFHSRSWTAEVLNRLHPAMAPHGIALDESLQLAAFEAALDAPTAAHIDDADLDGASLESLYADTAAAWPRLAPVVVSVEMDERLRDELEASTPTLGRGSEPQISFVVTGGDGESPRIAATLASLSRLRDLRSEAIVIADETTGDVRSLAARVRAAGPNARMLHLGRDASLLRIMEAARAPLAAFLEAGDRVAPDFGQWAVEAMAEGAHVAAPAWATLHFARPGPARGLADLPAPVFGPAAVFRRETLAELGGAVGIRGLRDAARRIVRYHGPGAMRGSPDTRPLAFAGNASIYVHGRNAAA